MIPFTLGLASGAALTFIGLATLMFRFGAVRPWAALNVLGAKTD